MTDQSKAQRTARRKVRRTVVRAGRREARRMIFAGDFDAMPTRQVFRYGRTAPE